MSRIPTTAEVMDALRQAPNGMTTREVARHLGIAEVGKVSARLSRLGNWGTIDREQRTQWDPRGGPARWFIWKLKEGTHA